MDIVPVGSVIQIEQRQYLVVGYRPSKQGKSVGIFYVTVPYPIGFVRVEDFRLCPISAVDEILFRGCKDGCSDYDLQKREALLPVGTIVKLKEISEAYYMVIGYYPRSGEELEEYAAVLCPEGFRADRKLLMFSTEQITKIVSLGYESELGKEITSKLPKLAEEMYGLSTDFRELLEKIRRWKQDQEEDKVGLQML